MMKKKIILLLPLILLLPYSCIEEDSISSQEMKIEKYNNTNSNLEKKSLIIDSPSFIKDSIILYNDQTPCIGWDCQKVN